MNGVDGLKYFADDLAQFEKALLEECQQQALNDNQNTELFDAMSYSLLSGGKRVRPLLVFASAKLLGVAIYDVMPFALAIEMIHCFSLIHDDLPAMDNDDFRRGLPTCHKKFNEALAILAGDNLLSMAFAKITELKQSFSCEAVVELVATTARYTGSQGMILGQALDIAHMKRQSRPTVEELKHLHLHKTGALILLSILAPALLSEQSPQRQEVLTCVGKNLGLAFQVADDALDACQESWQSHKEFEPSFVNVYQSDELKKLLYTLKEDVFKALEEFPEENSAPLKAVATFIIERQH